MYGMMIHGEVFDVTERTVGNDMKVAEVAVKSVSTDPRGRPVELYYDVRISPEMVREGYHNTMRTFKGRTVFLPVSTSIYQGKSAIQQYNLAGLPINLQVAAQQPKATA